MFKIIAYLTFAIVSTAFAADVDTVTDRDLIDVCIHGAQIIDVSSKTVFSGDLAIRDGKIVGVFRRPNKFTGKARTVIEAKGKWLIPGLHDMHLHAWRGNYSPGDEKYFDSRYQDIASRDQIGYRLLFSGITSYLDLGGPSRFGNLPDNEIAVKENVFDYRNRERNNESTSPRIFAAGPLWAVPGSHSGMTARPMNFKTILVKEANGKSLPEDQVIQSTRDSVNSFIAKANPDVIKIIYDNHEDLPSNRPERMPLYVARTIIQAAGSHGIKTIAHVGTWQAVGDLARVGIAGFTHLPHGAPPQAVIDALRKNKTVAISTIAVFDDLGDMKDASKVASYVDNPLLKLLTSVPFASTLLDYTKYDAADQAWADWGQKHSANRDQETALLALFRAGVQLLPGTDSMNTGAIHGYSLHRELVKWQESGIPRWDILQAATLDASRFLGENAGVFKVGANADVVILRANPLDDIANTQLIDEVIVNGRRFDQDKFRPLMVKSNLDGI